MKKPDENIIIKELNNGEQIKVKPLSDDTDQV